MLFLCTEMHFCLASEWRHQVSGEQISCYSDCIMFDAHVLFSLLKYNSESISFVLLGAKLSHLISNVLH